jgi:hypothetical protein
MYKTTETIRIAGTLLLAAPYLCLAVIAWLTRRQRSVRWLVIISGIVMAVPSVLAFWHLYQGRPEGGRAILLALFLQLPVVGLLGIVYIVAYGLPPMWHRLAAHHEIRKE